MTILQQSFMLRTPDGLVEKVSVKDNVLDCMNYMSKSGSTFNGCFRANYVELEPTRGLYRVGEPLFSFESRGKITRDYDRMRDLIHRFLREFYIIRGLVYYDNFTIRVYDMFRKAIMLEDTPIAEQGHLYIYRLHLPIELTEKVTINEKILNHMITFTNPVSTYHEFEEDFHLSPGYGFMMQNKDAVTAKIASPDHGEAAVELPAGQWLFLHSPPRRNVD